MRVTMDRVGRVVVPKRLREQLGVGADSEFEVVVDGSALRLEPIHPASRRITMVDGWPCLEPAVGGRATTDDDVRALRDGDQR